MYSMKGMRPVFCSKHKHPGMIDVVSARCEEPVRQSLNSRCVSLFARGEQQRLALAHMTRPVVEQPHTLKTCGPLRSRAIFSGTVYLLPSLFSSFFVFRLLSVRLSSIHVLGLCAGGWAYPEDGSSRTVGSAAPLAVGGRHEGTRGENRTTCRLAPTFHPGRTVCTARGFAV